LCRVYENQEFIFHAGDCAEPFKDNTPEIIHAKLTNLRQLSKNLEGLVEKPTHTIARQAGQYAKPRTVGNESVNGETLLAYQGDMINSFEPTVEGRKPDPLRMLLAYKNSKLILDYNTQHLECDGPLFFSHEALLLHYEECLTRQDLQSGSWFNSSAHIVWLGMRTVLDSPAHLEYASGIVNPIAVKIGANSSLAQLSHVLRRINPDEQPGKIIVIYRFGVDKVADRLPELIELLNSNSHKVLLLCDPMHGNTKMNNQHKIRHPSDIVEEVLIARQIHDAMHSPLHGIHLEVTYEDVDECVEPGHDTKRYKSLVDPRLNPDQCEKLFEHIALQEKISDAV